MPNKKAGLLAPDHSLNTTDFAVWCMANTYDLDLSSVLVKFFIPPISSMNHFGLFSHKLISGF